MDKASMLPFKPVETLLGKIVNRYFAAKNRERDLIGYANLYIAFQRFFKKVCELNAELEKGMVDNGILVEPNQTLYLRDIETKIQAFGPEEDEELGDVDTADVTVFTIEKMNKADFMYLAKNKK